MRPPLQNLTIKIALGLWPRRHFLPSFLPSVLSLSLPSLLLFSVTAVLMAIVGPSSTSRPRPSRGDVTRDLDIISNVVAQILPLSGSPARDMRWKNQ